MKIKQTILVFTILVGFGGVLIGQTAIAGTCAGVNTSIIDCSGQAGIAPECADKLDTDDSDYPSEGADPSMDADPVQAATTYFTEHSHNFGVCRNGNPPTYQTSTSDIKKTGIWYLLIIAINILTAGIGVVAVGGLVYGSILYASAGGGPEQVKKAKTIITDIAIGLVAYAFMYAFLNFIIPGGLFS